MGKSKVIYYGETLIDLTADTVQPSDVAYGKTFHDKAGDSQTGTNTFDADTSDATAVASEILATKTAYANGSKVTGTMPNRGAIAEVIADKDDVITIPQGYHDGSGTVQLDSTEKAKLIAGNIKSGVNLFGVVGDYEGEGGTYQSKTATPLKTSQTILPDAGYDGLSQVIVNAVPYVETLNASGGYTVTIG